MNQMIKTTFLSGDFFRTVPGHDLHGRAIEAKVDTYSTQQLLESVSCNKTITPTSLSDVAGRIFTPSYMPTYNAKVPDGFQNYRLAFILRFVTIVDSGMGGSDYHYTTLIGHTDHDGISQATGYMDPNMNLIVDSFSTMKSPKLLHEFSNGAGANPDQGISNYCPVRDSENMIASADVNDRLFLLRPEDVTHHTGLGFAGANIFNEHSALTPTARASHLDHARPNVHLDRLLNGYMSGRNETLRYGGNNDSATMLNNITMQVRDPGTTINFVLMEINKFDLNAGKVIPVRIMNLAYPDFDSKCRLTVPPNVITPYYEYTQHWSGADKNTFLAYTIAAMLPGIMMETKAGRITISMSNMNGLNVDSIVVACNMMHNFLSTPADAECLKRIIERDIVRTMLRQHCSVYEISIDASIVGDCIINISIDGSQTTPYSIPMWCSSSYTPLVGTGDILTNNANALSVLCEEISNNIPYINVNTLI